MNSSLFIWAVLVIIGVSDAKLHRIPNKLLILLLILLCLSTLMRVPYEVLRSVFLDKSLAFLITFIFGIVLYLLRVMAPGDVKFIAVLGFFLGSGELVNYLYYVSLITVLVGSMYWLLNRLHVGAEANRNTFKKEQIYYANPTGMAVAMQLNQQDFKRKLTTGKGLTYMPFAPILIIGLALHQYYT